MREVRAELFGMGRVEAVLIVREDRTAWTPEGAPVEGHHEDDELGRHIFTPWLHPAFTVRTDWALPDLIATTRTPAGRAECLRSRGYESAAEYAAADMDGQHDYSKPPCQVRFHWRNPQAVAFDSALREARAWLDNPGE